MLQAIRSTVGSWVVKILFVLLIVSFAVWGVGDISGGGDTDAARVGDVAIGPQELQAEFEREVNQMRQMLGPQFTTEQAVQLGMPERALSQLVQRTLLSVAARDKGLVVPDAVVAQQIREVEGFRNALGQFDINVMRAVLAQNGYTEDRFVELVRGDIARQQLITAIGSGAAVPDRLASDLFRFQGEQRVADTVTIPAAAMPDPAAPTDEALVQYHQDNSIRYTAPEYRTLTVAALTADDLAGEIPVSEEAVEQAYAARSAEFIRPERRTIAQVVAPDADTAKLVSEAVVAGQPLEQAAANAGLDVVALPDTAAEDLLPELAEPVFAAPPGQVAGPVESPLGWHVFRVDAVTPGGETPLAEVRDRLIADVRREQALDRLFEVANAMDDAIAGGATLAEAVAAHGGRVVTLDRVDVQGRTPVGAPAADLPFLAEAVERGFALQGGETSQMTEFGDDTFFAVTADAVEPAALRPLDTIRDQVLADWVAERKAAAAAERAAQVAERLRAGADPATVAAEIPGATTARTAPFLREPRGTPPLPPPVLAALFDGPVGTVATGQAAAGQVVARLTDIVPADPVLGAAQVRQVEAQLADDLAGDILAQYLGALRTRYGVEENPAVINRLFRPQE